MKRTIIVSLITCLFTVTGTLVAQNYRFGFTVGGGITNAHITGIPASFGISRLNYPLLSLNVNAFVGYQVNNHLSLSLEPGWILKGSTQHRNELRDQYRLHYLQLPILANYNITPKLTLSAGPELGYLLKGTLVSEELTNDITTIYTNGMELSGLVGISYHFTSNIEAGIRYNHGITSAYSVDWTDENGTVTAESRQYNQYAQLIVRYTL